MTPAEVQVIRDLLATVYRSHPRGSDLRRMGLDELERRTLGLEKVGAEARGARSVVNARRLLAELSSVERERDE